MSDEATPEREGYVYLGSVGVDSGQLMISDPCCVLPEDEETQEARRQQGMKDMRNTYPTYQEAMAITDTATFGVLREEMAVLFLAGHGDGIYPVFGKLNETGRIVEVVIDMQLTDFQKAVFEVQSD